VPLFRDTFLNISAIDDAYSHISGCVDTIQTQNKMLTIWLLHKVYYRLLTASVCALQAIEDNGIDKKFSYIPLQNHRINS